MTESTDILVRAGTEADLPALTDIYNRYVRETPITFDIEPFTPEERRPWLLSHPEDGPHRLLVAVRSPDVTGLPLDEDGADDAAGRILGYATSGPFHSRPAYASSVEVSIYCSPDARGQGIGTLLYSHLFKALEGEDVHRAFAGVTQPNEASTRLHTRFGFAYVGTYREVGRKFGRYWDVAWYEKPLGG